jgi:crotonobetainyl-CoA:carnitine CoA-transferase CaiB-like acyl-CoA transferase
MTSVLEGIRVIDLSVARAGPAAVRLLAEWGASVVRVEIPGEGAGIAGDHSSSDYINLHGNKELITLDLKQPEGREILLSLIDAADIVVENFRPPVKKRLGIDYDALAERFPRLIYGSISGYGQDGPLGDKGAVDQIIQGMSGLMSITGEPGQPPTRVGIAVADMAAGVLLANGLLLALLERVTSDKGQWVRVSLLEALLSMLDFQAARWTVDGEVPAQAGNHHPTITPMGTFSASDGYLNIAAPNNRLWERLCDALGRPEALSSPRFSTVSGRHENRETLKSVLQQILATRSRSEWVELLDSAGVPCGPVNSVAEAFEDPQTRHLDVLTRVDHPDRGEVNVLRTPITMSRTAPAVKTSSPTASQDTDRVLSRLGYSPEDLDRLRASGVI